MKSEIVQCMISNFHIGDDITMIIISGKKN
jgi:hypothetical protein